MKILTLSLIFTLLCFVNPFTGNAQQGYSLGYIILPNNDTVSGFLKEQNSRKALQVAIFKKEINGTKEVYTPDQIKAYRYAEGKYYISHPLVVKGKKNQVFLEYLIKGKANVYFTYDGDEHFYIQKEGGELVELTEPETYTEIKGKLYISQKKYKDKLSALLSDADLQPSIQKTSLEYKSLISLAKEYHEKVCDTEACIVYARKKNKVINSYTVFAGYSMNRYNFRNKLVTNFEGGLQVGFLASFRGLVFSNEKLGFSIGAFLEKDDHYEVNYSNEDAYYTIEYKGDLYYMLHGSDNPTFQSTLEIELNKIWLGIPLTVNYYQPVKRSLFIFGLGVSNRISFSKSEDFRIIGYNDYNENYEVIETYFFGGTAFIGYESKISSSNKITFNVATDYVQQFKSQFTVLQFTARIGFTF